MYFILPNVVNPATKIPFYTQDDGDDDGGDDGDDDNAEAGVNSQVSTLLLSCSC